MTTASSRSRPSGSAKRRREPSRAASTSSPASRSAQNDRASSDWTRHGHHADPAYDATLLHVVLWHDAGAPVRCHAGRSVPTLALADYLLGPLAEVAATLPAAPVELPAPSK